MITPQRFIELFGAATVRVVPFGLTPTALCDRSEHRYALWIFGPTVALSYRPAGVDPASSAVAVIAAGGDVLITHHEHLSIVNLSFEGFNMGLTGEVHVLEAMMPPNREFSYAEKQVGRRYRR